MSSLDQIYPYSFDAQIEKFGVGRTRKIWYNVLFLPDELKGELPFDAHPRLRVEGEIADVPIENAFIPAGDGRNYVIIAPNVMRDAGLTMGDVVTIRFRIADQDHVDVPEALDRALRSEPDTSETWATLSSGRKRMVAQHVKSAKTEPTRNRRVREALDAIRSHNGDLRSWRNAQAATSTK